MPPTTTDLDTETRILEAAHRVFVRRGVAAARTQEIADEAGVNKALLHYYFRTKKKLSDAVFLQAAGRLFPQMLRALASDVPLREKLQAAINAQMDAVEASPFRQVFLAQADAFATIHDVLCYAFSKVHVVVLLCGP